MVLMITPGSTDSTFTVCDVLVLLPTLSVADAVTVYNASPNAPTCSAGTVVVHFPLLSTIALYALPFSITVTTAPVARPEAVPEIVRSWVFSVLLITSSPETVSMVSTGAVRFTSTPCVALLLLPALSVSAAVMV